MEGLIPWKCRELYKLCRPVITRHGAHLHVAISYPTSQSHKLAPQFYVNNLLPVGISVVFFARTHVRLVGAQSYGWDQADIQSTA